MTGTAAIAMTTKRQVRGAARGAAHKTTMRLTVRGKVVVTLLAAMLAWGGMSMLAPTSAHSENGVTSVSSYIVRPGDTLWSYAASITPAGGDVSNTVDELIDLNNLESGALQAGQRIIVPQR